MKSTFEQYRDNVIKEALKSIGGPICTDTIKDSYASKLDIIKAAEKAVDDTLYWEGEF